MPSQYSVPITLMTPVPFALDAVITQVERILSKIGLESVGISSTPPDWASSPPPTPAPPLSLEEALALLESFDDGPEIPPPVGPIIPQDEIPVATIDFGSREIILFLRVLSEIPIELPGLAGVTLVLNPDGFQAVFSQDDGGFGLQFNIGLAVRIEPNLLKPLRRITAPDGSVRFEPDETKSQVQLDIASASISVTHSGTIEIDGGVGVSLAYPVMIGDTGVVIEQADLSFSFGENDPHPQGTPQGWRGILIDNATIRIPEVFSGAITADGFGIGSGGISGTIGASFALTYSDGSFSGDLVGEVFGMPGGLESVSLTLQQNIPSGGGIKAKLLLPFFEATDKPLDIEIGFSASGAITVAVGSPNGIMTLTKPNVLSLQLDSIGFEIKGGVFLAKLSGQLTPLFGADKGLVWPAFDVKELSINSKGDVLLKGGWLALPKQQYLDFHGFKIGITKIGFGKTDDGGKWVGFSGELKLVDGFPAGASVDGLKVTWYEGQPDKTKVTLEGVGVEFEIPDVLRFKGHVAYQTLDEGNEQIHRFVGDIKLNLIALKMDIDAKLIIGSAKGPQGNYNFFAIYLAAELPTGIPITPTPLALYGMEGLFALQMGPNKTESEEWYDGWYKRGQPGVTDLEKKWVNRRGSMAFGVGATVGTTSDQGFTFACKALLVIVFPGPIFLLEGKANLLKERAKLNDDPMFRALAVLDMREGQILIGLDAKYQRKENGEVIDIRAGAEAFFKDPSHWHVYMGEKEPREKRIRALVIKLFEANAYFMIDPSSLKTGIWVGYAKQWKFGPVKLTVEAWIEANLQVNWTPLHFHGDLWLHGNVEINVFGFGLGLCVDARFEADVFEPYHVKASIEVSIKLPRPLKKKHVEITLEWGPKAVWPELLPLPLKEVAIEHFKVTTSWPLSKNVAPRLLRPKYDFEKDGLRNYDSTAPAFSEPELSDFPVVPLDCRPHISFGRNVNDDAFVGVNPQLVQPEYEQIGDPDKGGPLKVRYSLQRIELCKRFEQAPQWRTVAVSRPNAGERALFGSWAAVPQLPLGAGQTSGANTKLWLWSITPFDYTRFSGSDGDDWFTANFPNYPCVPQDIPNREVCCDFEGLERSQLLDTPWQSPEHPEIALSWQFRTQHRVTVLDPPINGFTRALCFPVATIVPPIPSTGGIPPLKVSPTIDHDELAPAPRPEQPSVVSAGVDAGSPEAIHPIPVTINLLAPAKRVKLLIVESKEAPDVCVDFRNRTPVTVELPHFEQGVTFGSRGATAIQSVPTTLGNMTGLNCHVAAPDAPPGTMNITLSRAATTVGLMLSYESQPLPIPPKTSGIKAAIPPAPTVNIAALDSHGAVLASKAMLNPQLQPEIIRFEGDDIQQIRISSPLSTVFLHELCFVYPDNTSSVNAIGFDNEGRPTQVFQNQGNEVEVSGENLVRVQVDGKGEICLLQICALFGPDPKEVAHRQEMAEHLAKEVVRWQDEGEVLEPFSAYRLTISTTIHADGGGELSGSRHLDQTEHAYFRTLGPPGLTKLSLPPGRDPADADKFDSGLEDLTRYVRQTIPATVPAVGEEPVMAKPFYRAYDVGVDFNEDYVDLMYKISGRDLGLYLYDSNNRAMHDAEGRLLVQSADWGTVEELTLTEGEQRWLALANSQTHCLPAISMESISHDRKLTSAVAGRVLEPDMVYEARLIPLLLREGFLGYVAGTVALGPSGKLGRWEVHDKGKVNTPSKWEVHQVGATPSRYLTQTSNIKSDDDTNPLKPGTILLFGNDPALDPGHEEQPSNWTDYRLSVFLSATGVGAIGVVFRYQDSDNYYRFSLDRNEKCRRLVSVVGGNLKILTQDDFTYEVQHDYLITVEAIAGALRVYQDGALIFEITGAALLNGSMGLYCYDNAEARYNDVRVDDFRQTAPVVYRYQFTTSRFANFFHHLHSYQDETWRATVEGVPGAYPAMAQAVKPTAPPTDDEVRAYETLATAVLGSAARQNPPEVQVSRVEIDGTPLAFLVRSPEPIDWLRAEITLSRTSFARTEPALPAKAKLAAVNFAANRIDIDSVVLLLREPMDLSAYRIEGRLVSWPLSPNSGVVIDAQTISGGLVEQSWATYRSFGAEKKLPAGTILQVQPGDSLSITPAGLAGVDAEGVDPADRILYSIELRLVAPDGKIVHSRHFLPDDDYVYEHLKVLRKADGTGFFMVKLDVALNAVPLSLEQYRLKLTYHRNNKARVSTSQTLSQAGSEADEVVTLDIPLQTQ